MHENRSVIKNQQTLLASLSLCLLFIAAGFIFPVETKELLAKATKDVLRIFGDYYLYFGFFVVVVLIIIALSPAGKIRLGSHKPEYRWFSWVAMLYSTGMGAGLMLRAVQEPVYYYLNPPQTQYKEADEAIKYTFFHWGFTPWAFYSLFGMIIGYYFYQKKRTMLSSSILEQRFQKKGLIVPIDTITILSTVLGVVAAVGLGSRQLLGGMNYFSENAFPWNTVIYIVLFTSLISTASAFSGLHNSIRRISNFNISIASILLVYVLLNGDILNILAMFGQALTKYIWHFVPMSLNLGIHKMSEKFLTDWTYFYWAFWLAWAPFTGVFIARISEGRTIRQFVLGTMFVPSFGTFVWFTVFGSSAFDVLNRLSTYSGEFDSIYDSIFIFLNGLPIGSVTSVLALILVFTFLITSIDSAIYVLSMFSDNGAAKPQRKHRLLWGLSLCGFTIALLFVGREELLQSASQLLIIFSLPFSFIYVFMALTLIWALSKNKKDL